MPIKDLFNRLFGGDSTPAAVSSGEPYPVPQPPPAPITPLDALTTVPLPANVSSKPPVSPPRSPTAFFVGRATDVGRVRTHNEDAFYVFTGEQEGSNAVPPYGLFVLADGMGGHQSGEYASSLACRVVAEQLLGQVYLAILGGCDRSAQQPHRTHAGRVS